MGLTKESPFPSRTRARATLAPTATQQVWREVTTEDQLRQALTPVDSTDNAGLAANTGRRIVIAGPITLSGPVEVSAKLPGLAIESHGHIPIWCGVDGIDAFLINAPLFTARGLLFFAIDGGNSGNFARAFVLKDGANQARILDCHAFGCDALVEGADGVDDVHVRGNDASTPSGRVSDCVVFNGNNWRIMGNLLAGSDTGIAVRAGASGQRAAIVGNDCSSDGINTSAGGGGNTISANTRAGTVTAHGGDNTTGGNI